MKIEKISENKFIINKQGQMRVPALIYANEQIIFSIQEDQSIQQILNVAELPGIINYALAMPDIHQGFGFPIGGVAAFDIQEGIVCPGGVGFDINCGVRLIKTNLTKKDIEKEIEKLTYLLFANIPSGVGSQGIKKFEKSEIKKISENGVDWLIKNGFADYKDKENIEDNGHIIGADPDIISEEALNRGKSELGTLGAGNHFLEIDYISKIYDKSIAKVFGLFENQVVIWIHSGSRGYGHQIAKEYIQKMKQIMPKYNLKIKDPELIYLPIKDPISQQYISAMNCAANYAYCNRQLITYYIRNAFEKVFNKNYEKLGLNILYDVCHNIAKFEEHKINNKETKLLIHRKGATRSFPAFNKNISKSFFKTGHPVLIPGDMRRGSYILVGTETAMQDSFGSVSHGAGRAMSRNKAKKSIDSSEVRKKMKENNILLVVQDNILIKEEAPEAYKNISIIIDVLTNNNLVKVIAKSLPISVVKG